jgi:peptidoglycan/LPS O-acetylase OafA/YrhL
MNRKLILWLTFLLSTVALLGFIFVYWTLLSTGWTKDVQPKPNFEFIAASLAGLVGGIVAAAFGQKLPDNTRNNFRLTAKLDAFGGFLTPFKSEPPREILAAAYALIYIGMSVWAIFVWVADKPFTPKLTDNLAVVSIGLFIAIVTAYLGDKNNQSGA